MKRMSIEMALIILASLFVGITFATAGNVTYTYDDAGRLITADYGGGKSITYTYDKAGNLLKEDVFVNTAPTLGSLIPSSLTSKAGTARTFSAVYNDANGYADLKTVGFLVSKTGVTSGAIVLDPRVKPACRQAGPRMTISYFIHRL